MAKNKKKPESQKTVHAAKKVVERAKAHYVVSWLRDGVWEPEEETHVSLGRKALMKLVRATKTKRLFKVRIA
jgi:hypothetical protein